jgi:hypothetical protein
LQRSAALGACLQLLLSRSGKFDPQKIPKYLRIHGTLHFRKPREIEAVRVDPAPGAKFRMLGGYINPRIRPMVAASKIPLLLALMTALGDARWELVEIRASLFEQFVILRQDPDFLPKFAFDRRFVAFTGIHAPLGKLPCSRVETPLADPNLPISLLQNGRDIELILDSIGGVMSRHSIYMGAGGVLLAVFGLLWLWQPERQVRKHTLRFLDRIESKDWSGFSAMMAEEYEDRWGHDKPSVVERSREVFRQFLILGIEVEDIEVIEADGIGVASGRVKLQGRGGPLAEMAIQRAATLHKPFTFTWRQASWKPWDWKLTRVDQPELELDGY